jgi:hypothetical protein
VTDTVHGTVPAILDAEAAASAPSAAPQVPPVLPSERLVRLAELTAAGADAHSIMRQTGHRSPVMLEVYAREHAP